MLQAFDEFASAQRDALEIALAGGDLSREQALALTDVTPRQIIALALLADQLRELQCGEDVSYVVNRNINFTNVCIKSCRFCAFSRDHRDGEGYLLDIDQILARVEQAEQFGATEICIQAGLPPKMDGELYIQLTRSIKGRFPHLHLHAFSPEEVLYGAIRSRRSTADYLWELRSAGLDSLPGTSAEILDPALRDLLAPGRISVEQWRQVIREAHQIGLRTTSTMMFGHLEGRHHWIDHMLLLRDIQKDTGGFTEFVPLGFVHHEAPLSFQKEIGDRRLGPSGHDVILVHALARLVLGRTFRNIQASWVKEGEKLASLLLSSGCNDLGGTLMNESISTAAGASHGQLLPPRRLQGLIRSVGRHPIQRNTVYDVLRRFDHGEDELSPLDQVQDSDAVFGSYRRLVDSADHRFVHPSSLKAGSSGPA